MSTIIEVEKLKKTFRSFQLHDIAFHVSEGCITGLIGIDGSGKSTIIKCLINLIQRDSGKVEFWGENINDKNYYGLPNLTKGWDEVIAYSGVSFCICVLYNAIMIPATYKFGASKSRMVLLVIVAILPTVGTLIMKKTGIKLSTIALTPQTIVMLCLGGILVIEFVSFMLSIKIRKKRE